MLAEKLVYEVSKISGISRKSSDRFAARFERLNGLRPHQNASFSSGCVLFSSVGIGSSRYASRQIDAYSPNGSYKLTYRFNPMVCKALRRIYRKYRKRAKGVLYISFLYLYISLQKVIKSSKNSRNRRSVTP